jgi:thiamine biosynthesis lipoprotein
VVWEDGEVLTLTSYPIMEVVTVARNAMATRFEIALHGDSTRHLRAAGEEALDEIEHWEARLSLYEPSSEIAHANARAAFEPVQISPPVFSLLERCAQLYHETSGLFDITIAPLVRCWGFMGGHGLGHMPAPEALEKARSLVGMHQVELDRSNFTVRFARPGVMLDLGAIGKGFAIEQAAICLREAEVTSALFHGGTSTVLAIGAPPDATGWKVAVEGGPAGQTPPAPALGTLELKDAALSASAIWGRCFDVNGRRYGHLLDPRTGESASTAVLSVVIADSATDTDALSTALLIGGTNAFGALSNLRPGMRTLLAVEDDGRVACQQRGITLVGGENAAE